MMTRLKIIVRALCLLVLGSVGWGLLISAVLPQPWAMPVCVIGGFVIGALVSLYSVAKLSEAA